MAGTAAPATSIQASIIADVKSYCGKDPLLPWLRGVKKLEESLPQSTIPEKLPLFLLKCVQEFESHGQYKNDLRFIRIWLKLMDYTDDPIHMLKRMEMNGIGTKKSLYYRALSLYYEKKKKYKEAERIYHLGMQINAEPLEELNDSYEQFLARMQRHNSKRNLRDEVRKRNLPLSARKWEENNYGNVENKKVIEDDTVVIKFVGKTVVGTQEVEDACHHGLLEPTINMKEAMSAINNMFKAPMASAFVRKRKPKEDWDNKISVYVDECDDKKGDDSSCNVFVEGKKDETFFVLEDDDISGKSREFSVEGRVDATKALGNMKDDLLEPTMCTKEAIDDINKMFAMRID